MQFQKSVVRSRLFVFSAKVSEARAGLQSSSLVVFSTVHYRLQSCFGFELLVGIFLDIQLMRTEKITSGRGGQGVQGGLRRAVFSAVS